VTDARLLRNHGQNKNSPASRLGNLAIVVSF